jgi:hypothetical protein
MLFKYFNKTLTNKISHMKAFSRVPDPFGEHLETINYQFPFKHVLQIEAIPQGKIHGNVILK